MPQLRKVLERGGKATVSLIPQEEIKQGGADGLKAKGITFRVASRSVLIEEASQAYKDVSEVVAVAAGAGANPGSEQIQGQSLYFDV